jgi:hypothetical protein
VIPSRPLDLGGIIGESIRIVNNTYWRAALLMMLFSAPGIIILYFGFNNALDGGEKIIQKFTDVSPEAPLLMRDYLISSNRKSTTYSIYRIAYPNLFHEIDSVKETITFRYPDSARTNISTRLDSIADIVDAKTGKSAGDEILTLAGGGLIMCLGGFLVYILGMIAAWGAFYDLGSRAYEERPLRFGNIFRLTIIQSMWLLLVQFILIFLAMITGLGLVLTISFAISPILGALGLSIAMFLLIYAAVRILFSGAALVSEELGPIEAIKRSLYLTKGFFGRVFGISFICGIIIYIADTLIRLPISLVISPDLKWVTEFIRGNTNMPVLFRGIKSDILNLALVSFISSSLIAAFFPAFLVTFYYDLRTRKEGALEYPENEELKKNEN